MQNRLFKKYSISKWCMKVLPEAYVNKSLQAFGEALTKGNL